MIRCRDFPGEGNFDNGVVRKDSVEDILSALEEHFEAKDVLAASKEVLKLKQRHQDLEERLQHLKAAKEAEHNSQLLIEQKNITAALVKEKARLSKDLTGTTLYVIC